MVLRRQGSIIISSLVRAYRSCANDVGKSFRSEKKLKFRSAAHCSVDLSATTIMPPRVRVPSTPLMLLWFTVKFMLYLVCEKRTKIDKKKPGLPYFQEQTPISILNNDDTIFQKMAKNWMWSSVKRVHLITPTIRVRILLTHTYSY